MKLVVNLKVNGVDFHKNSVLSFYGILLDEDKTIKTYERYYYPKESFNHPNIDRPYISEMRKLSNETYPQYFEDDFEIKMLFINNDVDTIIGHNLMFDLSFISKSFKIYDELKSKKLFCTMLNNTYVFQLPLENLKNTLYYKFPSLKKTMVKYKLIKFDDDEYSSKFYAEAIKDIYFKTLKELEKLNLKELEFKELIHYYKANLINYVLCDNNFLDIDNNSNCNNIIPYSELTRKYKKIVDDYNVSPSMIIKGENAYSMKKLTGLNNIITYHTLEFTTKYPITIF